MNLTEVLISCVSCILLFNVQVQQMALAYSSLHHWQALAAAYVVLSNAKEFYYSGVSCLRIRPLLTDSLTVFSSLLTHVSINFYAEQRRCLIRITWQEHREFTLTQWVQTNAFK